MEPKIREYLLEKQAVNGWSQDDMANKLSVPKSTLSRWLHGHFVPNRESLKKIAKSLEVPVQELYDAADGEYKPLSDIERKAIMIEKTQPPEVIEALLRRHAEKRFGAGELRKIDNGSK